MGDQNLKKKPKEFGRGGEEQKSLLNLFWMKWGVKKLKSPEIPPTFREKEYNECYSDWKRKNYGIFKCGEYFLTRKINPQKWAKGPLLKNWIKP